MRLLPLLAAALVVSPAPASADPELATIECYGVLPIGVTTRQGSASHTGSIACALGIGGPTGYSIVESFSTSVAASITNTAVAGGIGNTSATLQFARGTRLFTLVIADPNVGGWVPMVNPDDGIYDTSAGNYRYNVRGGYLRSRCGVCLVDSVLQGRSFHVTAEYVFDLPVQIGRRV